MGQFFKVLEKLGDFAQCLAQNWPDWHMNESLFLAKLVLYGSTFKFHDGMSLPKPNLSTPLLGNNYSYCGDHLQEISQTLLILI